jgi:stress-induced morphogen
MREIICFKLGKAGFSDFEVLNMSHLHKGHLGDNGTGESHFKLLFYSRQILTGLELHRKIYEILQEEMKIIHALEIVNVK